MNNMSPMSKKKTRKQMASIPSMSPVKKGMCNLTNIRIHEEYLFMDGEDLVPEFSEKVISFVLDNDNSFSVRTRTKEYVIEGTWWKLFMKISCVKL